MLADIYSDHCINVCLSEVLILQFPIQSDIFSSLAMQGYIFFKGGGIIFVTSAKNGEDYLYLEIFVQILIKSKILLNIF